MDIDIDISPKFKPEDLFPKMVRASIIEKGEVKKHQSGVYFQDIPVDMLSGLSAIPHRDTDANGYFKIDMLNVTMLADWDIFDSKEEIRALTKKDPDWSLLEDESIVRGLFHLSKHAPMVASIKPRSVSELADCLALIRPEKRHLIDKYIKNRKSKEVLTELYTKRDSSDLRKSHAVPYALLIVIQLHLIKADLI